MFYTFHSICETKLSILSMIEIVRSAQRKGEGVIFATLP